MALKSAWVVVETAKGVPTPVGLELLTFARQNFEEVCAIAWGKDAAAQAEVTGKYGAKTLFVVDVPEGELPGPVVGSAVAEAIKSRGAPDAILIGTSYDGRDIAGRLSAAADLPVITNVIGLEEAEGRLVALHAVFGGTLMLKSRFADGIRPQLFVVRSKSFEASPGEGPAASVEELSVPELGRRRAARIVSHHEEELSGPKLDEADIVVSGGRGLGDPANYKWIEELARLLKGAPGASRAIVDAGWVPYSYQVGQTGKTVKPNVYIACGISGATQHLVGMKNSKHIIAINKDKDAPIFSVADLGVVGDVKQVLPRLIEALQARLGAN
jgi:electron transfer flavoprotein alpha subunit